ncbi:RecF/RecN/SMC N terminal domain [Phytophthora infestans]|uniref:RecF/RecN/SMC N terminal domain n=1 Tax=Phytophthora infestans TaxID=4787 RepID=A0A833VVZ6_PHYIN|nr:RecF/RecN/SMC N terminal domain [Phytophthora infestans]KAF4149117.1 RecF/RecN/SMC N terminal domain [Phytophthora infestans]
MDQLRQQAHCTPAEANTIISARTGHRYRNLELPYGDLADHAMCNVLQVSDDEVFNALIDTCGLENQLLFDDREAAESRVLTGPSGAFRMVPHVAQVFLPTGDKFLVRSGNLAYITNKRDRHGYIISQNVDQGIDEIKYKVDYLERKKDELRRDEAVLSHDKNELGYDIKQETDRINYLSRRLNQQRVQLRCLDEEMADVLQDNTMDTTVLEGESKATEDELADFQQREQDLNKTIASDRTLQDSLDTMDKLETAEKEIATEMTERHADADAVYKRLREAKVDEITGQNELETARAAVKELEQQLIATRDESDEQAKVALKLGGKPAEVHSPAYCSKRIKTVERQREQVQKNVHGLSLSELKAELDLQGAKYREKKSSFDKVRGNLQCIRSMLEKRVDTWTRFRRAISKRTSAEFDKCMQLSNFAGKLRFYHRHHRLEIGVLRNEKGATSSSQMTDMKELSGGERSFTQVSLLLALGSSSECPFRIMDEFDVFMDSQNRSMTVDLLVEAAKKNCRKQFVFVTPNDLSTLRPDPKVKIQKLDPPRDRAVLAGE